MALSPISETAPAAPHMMAPHLMAPGPAARLLDLLMPVVVDLGYGLVRIKITGEDGQSILQVMAERDDGTLSVDDCEVISHGLSALLDVEDPISGAYSLEVSSPGLARPLTRAADFSRYAGYDVKIELQAMVDGQRRFRGLLVGFEEGEVLLETVLAGFDEPQILGFELSSIGEAHLVVTEEMLKSSLKGVKPAGRARK